MEKKELRAQIKTLKKQHTKEQLMEQSEKILAKLEQHPDFIKLKESCFTVLYPMRYKPNPFWKNGT